MACFNKILGPNGLIGVTDPLAFCFTYNNEFILNIVETRAFLICTQIGVCTQCLQLLKLQHIYSFGNINKQWLAIN